MNRTEVIQLHSHGFWSVLVDVIGTKMKHKSHICILAIQIFNVGAKGIAQWLGALTHPPEDQGSILNTHVKPQL